MQWQTKKLLWLGLLQYLFYCGGLEQSLQNLRGMPIYDIHCNSCPYLKNERANISLQHD